MNDKIALFIKEAKANLATVSSLTECVEAKKLYLGKKGKISELLKSVGELSIEEKKTVGKAINEAKNEINHLFSSREQAFAEAEQEAAFREEVEPSLPGRANQLGYDHPLTITKRRIVDFFKGLGFAVVEGPEVETEYYNFEALNIPAGHPARDEQDSMYLQPPYMLRTQTSPMQIRSLEISEPPLAVISPGKVFRRDTLDATHSYCFHQIEGLLVNKEVNFTHLKGLLIRFCNEFFGEGLKFRFRPDFFPFTEPSCEVAIEYPGKSDGWLEILGAGMVNPLVLKNSGIDPEEYTGLAFGLGVERIAMLLYGVDDIRLFYENDLSFLKQFSHI